MYVHVFCWVYVNPLFPLFSLLYKLAILRSLRRDNSSLGCRGAALCVGGFLTASLASAHQMPIASPTCETQNYIQTFGAKLFPGENYCPTILYEECWSSYDIAARQGLCIAWRPWAWRLRVTSTGISSNSLSVVLAPAGKVHQDSGFSNTLLPFDDGVL